MGKKRCLKRLLCVVEKNNSHLVISFRIFSEQKLDCALWELARRPGYADHLKYSRGRHCFLCDRPHWCGCKLGRHQTQPNRSGRVFDTRSVKGRLGIGVGLCQGVSKPRPGSGGTFYYVAVGLLSSGCFGGKASFEHLAGSGGSWLYALGIFASNTTRYFP